MPAILLNILSTKSPITEKMIVATEAIVKAVGLFADNKVKIENERVFIL